MKILGPVIGVLLVLGILFMLVGVSMGAKMGIYWDADGIHVGGDGDTEQVVINELNLEPFDDIDLKMISYDIEFIASDSYGFELVNNNNTDITWSLQNGKLAIAEKTRGRWWGLDLSFFRGAFKNTSSLKVYLPAGTSLENVFIKNVSGKIAVSGFSCTVLDINIVSGRTEVGTELSSITASSLVFEGVSGGLNMQNCQLGAARINSVSGDTWISGMKTGELSLGSISGNIFVSGELLGSSGITSVSGDVRLQIKGNNRDYGKQFNIISGSLRIDGQSYHKNYSDNNGAPNRLKVASTSGNVTVDFVQ